MMNLHNMPTIRGGVKLPVIERGKSTSRNASTVAKGRMPAVSRSVSQRPDIRAFNLAVRSLYGPEVKLDPKVRTEVVAKMVAYFVAGQVRQQVIDGIAAELCRPVSRRGR
jgi:hypothetical protein